MKHNKIILFLLAIFITTGISLIVFGISPVQIYKEISFQRFYSKLATASANQDCSTLYSLISDELKSKYSYETYVGRCESKSIYSLSHTVHSYTVKGNIGYVDRTSIVCVTEDCTGENRKEARDVKKYSFQNFKWVVDDEANTVYCTRETPYNNPPEFQRAVSLIIQRYKESNYKDINTIGEEIQMIQNCLNIQYADSSQQIDFAEGLFSFDPYSNNDNLSIQVSPEYQTKDDLLTSILLVHELMHAEQKVFYYINSLPCYEAEAQAFTSQYNLFTLLNQEEQNSLLSRSYSYGKARDTLQEMANINTRYRGNNYYEKALAYVQSHPSYQQQCAQ